MDRPQAEKIFALVNELRGDLQEQLIPQRWWIVWMFMGPEIFVSNGVTQRMLNHGETRMIVHMTVWSAQLVAAAGTIRIAQRRAGGYRSQRETLIWWIWMTFLSSGFLLILLNSLLRLPLFATASVLPLLASFAFSMMCMAVHRSFAAPAYLFAACALLMAKFPTVQFVLYGTTWLVVLEMLAYRHRPRILSKGRTL